MWIRVSEQASEIRNPEMLGEMEGVSPILPFEVACHVQHHVDICGCSKILLLEITMDVGMIDDEYTP